MALVRDIDSGALSSTIANTQNSNSAKANAQVALTRTQQDKALESAKGAHQYQIDTLDREQGWMVFDTVLSVLKLGVSAGQDIYNLVKSDQIQKANNNAIFALNEGEQILSQSIYDGTTTFKENPDTGELEFSLAPAVQQWHDRYVKSINESDMMSKVKELALSSFEASYSNVINQGFSEAITRTYTDLNDQFQSTLEQNLKNDVTLVAANGGVLGGGMALSGIATITGRGDWSAAKKEAKSYAYVQAVMSQASMETASQIARTQGMKAAEEFIYSQPHLSVQDKQNAYNIANTSLTQRSNALNATASSYMEQALIDGSSTPDQIYASLASTFANEAPEIRESVYSAAKEKQSEIVQIMIDNQYNSDIRSGLESLMGTLNDLQSGKFDAYFVEIPEKKTAAVSTYITRIDMEEKELASALATSQSKIKSADTAALSAFEKNTKSVQSAFDLGNIDGSTAVAMISGYAQAAAEQINGVDTLEAMALSAQKFVYNLADDYIPVAYKENIKNKLSAAFTAMGLSKTTGLTEEQTLQKQQVENYTYGLIADMIYESRDGKVSPEQIAESINQIKIAVTYDGLARGWKKIGQGTAVPAAEDTTSKAALQAANETNNALLNSATGMYILYDDNADADYKSFKGEFSAPQIKFINQGFETSYTRMTDVFKAQISMYTGVSEDKIVSAPGRNEQGSLVPSPVFSVATNGGVDMYRIRNSNIQKYSGGTWMKVAETSYDPSAFKAASTQKAIAESTGGQTLASLNDEKLNANYLKFAKQRDNLRLLMDRDDPVDESDYNRIDTICKQYEMEIGRRAMSKRNGGE